MRKWILASLVPSMLIVGTLTGCGSSQPAASAKPPADTGLSAPVLFKNNCAACHGANLQGGMGPNLQHVGQAMDAQAIETQIRSGGGGMPPFAANIGPKDIVTLATWLAAKK